MPQVPATAARAVQPGLFVPRTDAEPQRTRGHARAWRILRAALVAVLSLYVVYVAAINVFLSTSLFDRVINQDREMLVVEYAKGWSLLPGTIHAKQLSIRSSDSNVEWILTIDEIEFDVSFLGLAQRRFDVGRAHGRGIRMLARQKLDAAPDTVEEIAYLPPIEGFPAFSVSPAGPPSPERWDDSEYRLWTVNLEDVIAEDVREVWVDSGRFEGNARITGRFHLKPIRAVEIGPARVDVREGRVTAGNAVPIAKRVHGTADVVFDRFDPREIEGNGIFRYFTLATDLEASFADPSTFPFAAPGGVHLSTEIEARRLALRVDRGVLAAGTRVELGTPRAAVAKANVVGYAALDLVSEVVTENGANQLRATAELKDVALVRADAVGVLRAPRIAIAADARALDLAARPLEDGHAVVDLPDVDLPAATVLNVYLPENANISDGSARGNARVELFASDRRASGRGSLHADELEAKLAKMRTRGTFDMTASFGSFRWEEDLVEDARLSIRVADGKLASEGDPTKPKVEAQALSLDATSMKLALSDPLRSFEARFAMPQASIVDLKLLTDYLPKRDMRVVRGRTSFALEGHVTIEEHLARGELHARSKALGLELGDIRVRAAVDARAKVHDWKWAHGDLVLDDASIDVTGVTMSKGDDPKVLASIEHVTFGLQSPAFAFSEPLARVDVRASVTGGKVSDPVAIDAFLPHGASYGLATDDGTFEADARLAISNHVARGRAKAKATRMGVRTAPLTVHGDTLVELDIERWDLEKKLMSLGASRIAFTGVRGRFGRGGTSELTGDHIELTGRAADLDIAHPALSSVDARLVVGPVRIPDARALQVLVPTGEAIRIESGSATASGEVELSSSARTGKGMIALEIARAGIAISKTRLRGDFTVQTRVSGFDPDLSALDLSGSHVAMRQVSVQRAAAETAHWKGDVVLDRATLRLRAKDQAGGPEQDGPVLDAIARLEADDARPLLGVLLRDSVPKLLVGLIDMPRLQARARLHVAPNEVMVSELSASGGDIALRGSFGLFDEDRRGAFIVEKGPISVGLRLDQDGAKPRFFDLDDWLAGQERNVKAKADPPRKYLPEEPERKAGEQKAKP